MKKRKYGFFARRSGAPLRKIRKGARSAQEAERLPALNASSVGKKVAFFRQNAGTPRCLPMLRTEYPSKTFRFPEDADFFLLYLCF